MDLLYVLGNGSRHKNKELLWSLRSVHKFASNVGRVMVVGYPPADMLSDRVLTLSVPDVEQAKSKHVNILNCIQRAVKEFGLREFLYSSDDHFLVKPVDFENYPYYTRGHRLASIEAYIRDNKYFRRWYPKTLGQTEFALRMNGYPTEKYCGHVNTHMNGQYAEEVDRIWRWTRDRGLDLGLEPTCLFLNVQYRHVPFQSVRRRDLKCAGYGTWDGLIERVGSRDTFSIKDTMFRNGRFETDMDAFYSEPSPYERS